MRGLRRRFLLRLSPLVARDPESSRDPFEIFEPTEILQRQCPSTVTV